MYPTMDAPILYFLSTEFYVSCYGCSDTIFTGSICIPGYELSSTIKDSNIYPVWKVVYYDAGMATTTDH